MEESLLAKREVEALAQRLSNFPSGQFAAALERALASEQGEKRFLRYNNFKAGDMTGATKMLKNSVDACQTFEEAVEAAKKRVAFDARMKPDTSELIVEVKTIIRADAIPVVAEEFRPCE